MTKSTLAIRKPYDPSCRVKKLFPKPTMAKQSFKDECDINNILKKFQTTGLISHTQKIQGAYGDFTNVTDYHESINRVNAAQDAFMELPSTIRKFFNNDPAQMLAFVDDAENHAKAIELGLIQNPDIAAEGGQSKPPEPLKGAKPKASKTPLEEHIDDKAKSDE